MRNLFQKAIVIAALSMVAYSAPSAFALDAQPQPQPEPQLKGEPQPTVLGVKVKAIRSDSKTACRLARYEWLEKAAEANPAIIAAITDHWCAARVLARHHRLSNIADADHYLCRRLTKWKTVARILAKNGEAYHVIALDPEGIYYAIKRDKKLAQILAKNPMFDQMIVENPDLGKLVASYM
jgi:hypothetical protein